MKFFTVLFVQLLAVHLAWSGLATLLDSKNSDHPGKCYIEGDPPTILSPGETVTLKGQCTSASCASDFSVEYASCGVVVVFPKEYYKPGNNSLPYPDCCPGVGKP